MTAKIINFPAAKTQAQTAVQPAKQSTQQEGRATSMRPRTDQEKELYKQFKTVNTAIPEIEASGDEFGMARRWRAVCKDARATKSQIDKAKKLNTRVETLSDRIAALEYQRGELIEKSQLLLNQASPRVAEIHRLWGEMSKECELRYGVK
jgi:hypothetical protein